MTNWYDRVVVDARLKLEGHPMSRKSYDIREAYRELAERKSKQMNH